jgi:hypothetical protein
MKQGQKCQYRFRDRAKCESAAEGRWNVYGRVRDNPTWLCALHAWALGIYKNPRVDI